MPDQIVEASIQNNDAQLDDKKLSHDSISKYIPNLKCDSISRFKAYFGIGVLFTLNLLNFIDRYTLAGILRDVQDYYKINDGEAGLLQTLFICSYMLLAPLFGYLGDRYNRKAIIVVGISIWSSTTLLGSFVPANHFWLFALFRALVGIGEASYSCLAPTIIGDLFTNEKRTRMLAVFYLATPVGSGLGYVIGSNVANAFGDWRWALRITPVLGLVCIFLLIFFVEEPKRGGAEGAVIEVSKTNLKSDVIYLLKNKSFMWTTFGFTFGAFVFGGLSWWIPTFVEYAIYSLNKIPNQVPLIFGVITCIAGLIGVAGATILSQKLEIKTKDPLICAFGSFIAIPTLYVCILTIRVMNIYLFWFIAAIAIASMCLCWTIVADIILYTIEPTRRSIASALNILICHLLGDAISPYIIGAISDKLREGQPNSYFTRFASLQYALYLAPFFAALSFASYLFASIFIESDKKAVEEYIKLQRSQTVESALSVISDGKFFEKSTEKNETVAQTQNETVDVGKRGYENKAFE